MAKFVQSDLPFKSHFSPPSDVRVVFKDASLTTQEDAEMADINNLLKKYALGEDVPIPPGEPFFGDFSNVPDMQSALDVMQRAEVSFSELPLSIRERFGHDPRALVDFVMDSRNREEAVNLGLVSPSAPIIAPEASKAEGGTGGVTSSPPSGASSNT